MKSQSWKFWCVLGLVVVVLLVSAWVIRRVLASNRAENSRKLLAEDVPQVRLQAAEKILAVHSRDLPARLVKAQALIELRQFIRAREILFVMERDHPQSLGEIYSHLIDSYLQESAQLIADSNKDSPELLAGRIDPLLNRVEELRQRLASLPDDRGRSTLVQARLLHARACLAEKQTQTLQSDLTKALAVDEQEQIALLGSQIGQYQGSIKQFDQQIENLCQTLLQHHSDDPRPLTILFDMWIRRQEISKARQVASQLVAHPGPLPKSLAASVAGTLVDLEWVLGLPPSPDDLSLADQLLHHPALAGSQTLEFTLALSGLALARHDWSLALQISKSTLQSYEGHPLATAHYAQALAGNGQINQATALLLPLVERVRSARLRYITGQVYEQGKQLKPAQQQYRQALDLQRDALLPRLALSKSLADSGFIIEAAPDIQTAFLRYPSHPQIRHLYIQLLIARQDLTTLANVLIQSLDANISSLSWQHVAMTLLMTLDDLPAASQLAQQYQLQSGPDDLCMLVQAWTTAPPDARFQVSSLLLALLLERLDADPLANPILPSASASSSPLHASDSQVSIVWENTTTSGSSSVLSILRALSASDSSSDSTTDTSLPASSAPLPTTVNMQALTLGRFVPDPLHMALNLAAVANDRWPSQPQLLESAFTLSLFASNIDQAGDYLLLLHQIQADQSPLIRAAAAYLASDFEQARTHLDTLSRTAKTFTPLQAWLEVALPLASNDTTLIPVRLEQALHDHPWNQPVLLMALRHALRQGRADLALQYLQIVRKTSPILAQLTQARLNLALGRLQEALPDLETILVRQPSFSELRTLTADVRAGIYLAQSRSDQAYGILEGLAVSIPHRRFMMQSSSINLQLLTGHTNTAFTLLTTLLTESNTPPRWLDHLLFRLAQSDSPQRLLRLTDNLLQYHPNNPVFLVHRIQALIQLHQYEQASSYLTRLSLLRPNTVRLLQLQARLALLQNQLPQAQALYEQLRQRTPRAALAAVIDQADLTPDTSPSPAPSSSSSPSNN